MRYLSVCSGIEAATCAWHPLDWEPAAFSEIEPFPRAVLQHHWPNVPLHGDFTTIRGDEYGSIDLLVGGTPCQSFSVAGLRGGLADDRGNLALEFLRLAQRARAKWLVWENVPGVLSSNGGRDFGSILGGLVELGYGFAYRVLDAQFFGVPQRRRRVFVVGYLGDWRRAAAVLFERHSLQGHPPPSRKAGQGIAGTVDASSGGSDENDAADGRLVANSLGANSGRHQVEQTYVARCDTARQTRLDGETDTFVTHSLRADGFDASEDGTGRGTPIIPIQNATRGDDQNGLGVGGDVMFTLDQASQHAIAFNARQDPINGPVSPPLDADDFTVGIQRGSAVRRLTPRECERLQGFPDDYTMVTYRGKSASDGPRYKALGNSMAVPVMRWIGGRIELVGRAILASSRPVITGEEAV